MQPVVEPVRADPAPLLIHEQELTERIECPDRFYCVRRTVLVHRSRIDLLHLGFLVFLVDELFCFFFRETDDADFHWVVEVWEFLEDFGEGDVTVVAVEGRGLFLAFLRYDLGMDL